MSELFKKQLGASSSLRLSRRAAADTLPCVLRRWDDPTVELALWERSWPEDLVETLDRFRFADLPWATFRTCKETAEVDVSSGLAVPAWSPAGDQERVFSALAMDIESLIVRFSCATDASVVEVRLQPIRDDACTLFHVDHVRARLTTTYLGPGTEWVPETHGADAVQLQGLYDGPVRELPRFGVGIFRGALSGDVALVHRSPRISGSGRVRLFLSITDVGAPR